MRIVSLVLFLILEESFFLQWKYVNCLLFMSLFIFRYVPSAPSLLRFFNHERMLYFGQTAFLHLLRWPCDFYLLLMCYIYWFMYVEPFLHTRHKSHLVKVVYSALEGFLNAVCWYFIEIFCSYIHQGYWSVLFVFCYVLESGFALLMPVS